MRRPVAVGGGGHLGARGGDHLPRLGLRPAHVGARPLLGLRHAGRRGLALRRGHSQLDEAADHGPPQAAPEGAAVVVTRHREHRFPGRRRPVQVRFGEEEFAAIELAAGRAGLTPTGYVGAVALAAARGTVPPAQSQSREALTELMAARAQVRRFGGNVNQAVAALNSTGETPQWLAQAVELTSRAVRQVDAAAEQMMRRRPETRT